MDLQIKPIGYPLLMVSRYQLVIFTNVKVNLTSFATEVPLEPRLLFEPQLHLHVFYNTSEIVVNTLLNEDLSALDPIYNLSL
jgi:hypothetical protein